LLRESSRPSDIINHLQEKKLQWELRDIFNEKELLLFEDENYVTISSLFTEAKVSNIIESKVYDSTQWMERERWEAAQATARSNVKLPWQTKRYLWGFLAVISRYIELHFA
jgi:hypothetical protein